MVTGLYSVVPFFLYYIFYRTYEMLAVPMTLRRDISKSESSTRKASFVGGNLAAGKKGGI